MSFLRRFQKNRFFTYGLPFMGLLIGGSFGLQQFAQLRYTFRNKKMISEAEADQMGVKLRPAEEKSIEAELEKLQTTDIDTWDNIRGPRPWEDSKSMQTEQRTKLT